MTFTALHRYLGDAPGLLTDDMIDRAIAAGAPRDGRPGLEVRAATARRNPELRLPKGRRCHGQQRWRHAGLRRDRNVRRQPPGARTPGELTEGYERGLRSAAVTAISPPIFGLESSSSVSRATSAWSS